MSCLFLFVYYTDKSSGKFKDWIDIESVTRLKINSDIIEVLCYLASGTVKRVCNACLVSLP